MDTRESTTPDEKREHVLDQRLPERKTPVPPHLEPEARRAPRGWHRLPLIAVALVGVILVVVVAAAFLRGP
ncbi:MULTISPECIES: hypothetical protein [unclassified Halomonas]|uniref:hypothetical protein n=1 Tax=unclassified Halomonas TaxID=2609666 RepID=UPI00209D5385|nr:MULTISPECIES: hypothetical protein [unclassified Halomonas]MCP1312892.1 hypothetical protein [Halomonas sp. 707D7]MCP1326638.1 hypothetical protein [Halomonas sp. 707D4]